LLQDFSARNFGCDEFFIFSYIFIFTGSLKMAFAGPERRSLTTFYYIKWRLGAEKCDPFAAPPKHLSWSPEMPSAALCQPINDNANAVLRHQSRSAQPKNGSYDRNTWSAPQWSRPLREDQQHANASTETHASTKTVHRSAVTARINGANGLSILVTRIVYSLEHLRWQ
jgi:hypothetical protein